jgi:hypothetical protein
MDENVERLIRDRAYDIWEEEGRPAGRDVEHWLRACQEIAAEQGVTPADDSTGSDTTGSGEAPAPKTRKPRAPKAAAAEADEAAPAKPRKSTKPK